MNTQDCINGAFSGESRVNRKYKTYSEAADEAGYTHLAKLFRATSAAEEIHARELLRVGGYIGSMASNLEAGIEAELRASTESYPAFISIAEKEDRQDAVLIFTHAMNTEARHAVLYKKALEEVKADKDFDAKIVYLCPVCGNVEIDKVPEHCPVCGVPGSLFRVIE